MAIAMYNRIVAAETDSYFVELQIVADTAHLHVTVSKWTPSVLKQLYKVFAELKELLTNKGFSYMVTISPNPKFAKLFGGEVVEEKIIDGVYYEVIVWDLIH